MMAKIKKKIKNNPKKQKSTFAKASAGKPVKRGKFLNKKKVIKKKLFKKPVKKIIVKKIVKNIKKTVKKVVKKKINKKPVKKNLKPKKTIVKKTINTKKPVIKKVKEVIKVKAKKIVAKPQIVEFSGESLFKAKIKVIGIGGGGGSIVSEIGRSLEKATFVIADTDIRALKKKSGIKYFWFGEELTHGLGTGVNVDLAKQAAESSKDKIGSFFKDQDIIIFVASLGGGLGSGATQVFAEVAKEFGGITLGIFTMPFKFEGKNKQRIAQNALKLLKQNLNVSLVIPNEKIFKVIDESTPITNAFSTVNKSLIGSLESLIDLIYNPGIINIDFADLRTILKGRGNSAFLNTIEESGKDRVEKICENIFKNPLLQNNGFNAEKILFNIVGSENLSMFEVEKISSHISNLNPKAKIIFGISKDAKLKNKIKTTILMTGGQLDDEITIEKEEPVKLSLPEKVKETVKKEVVVVNKEKSIIKSAETKKLNLSKEKKVDAKKSNKKPVRNKPTTKESPVAEREEKIVSIVPDLRIPVPSIRVLDQRRLDIAETVNLSKKTIRRSGLEIREAEDLQEKKRIAQEKEWEIPAFLRKVKFKG